MGFSTGNDPSRAGRDRDRGPLRERCSGPRWRSEMCSPPDQGGHRWVIRSSLDVAGHDTTTRSRTTQPGDGHARAVDPRPERRAITSALVERCADLTVAGRVGGLDDADPVALLTTRQQP